jgi:hypothetical protein
VIVGGGVPVVHQRRVVTGSALKGIRHDSVRNHPLVASVWRFGGGQSMPGSVIREVSGTEATEPVDMRAEPPCRNPPATLGSASKQRI